MRKVRGPMSEDLELRIVSGPPRYTSRTDKPVEHLALADDQGNVIGYIYANDEDEAAGWQARPAAGFHAQNLVAPWIRMLHEAKRRSLKPSAALDELMGCSHPHTHIVPNSRQRSANLAALKELAGDMPPTASVREPQRRRR